MEDNYRNLYLKLEKDYWWFMGRREVLRLLVGNIKKKNVLDIGCSSGIFLKSLKDNSLYGIDIDYKSLKYADGVNVAVANAENLPYKDDSFHYVFCSDILEHVDDDIKVLKEIYRILKSNGNLILAIPVYKFLWGYQDFINFHKRRYSKKEIIDKINNVGFKIDRITYWNLFLFPFVLLKRKVFDRILIKKHDLINLSRFVNGIFYLLIRIENYFISKKINLPFGVSLLVVVRK